MLNFCLFLIICNYFIDHASGNNYIGNCENNYTGYCGKSWNATCDCENFKNSYLMGDGSAHFYCPHKNKAKINVTIVSDCVTYVQCDKTMSVNDYDLIDSMDLLGHYDEFSSFLYKFAFLNCVIPEDGFKRIFRKFPNARIIETVVLYNCLPLGPDRTFRREHFNGFDEVKVRELTVNSAEVLSLFANNFVYLPKIDLLKVEFLSLEDIVNSDVFRKGRQMKTVLKQTPVNFTKEFFTHLTRTTSLYIEQSIQPDTLQYDAFELLHNVGELELVNNGLTTLPSGLFHSNEHLRTLTIIEPELKSQPNDLLEKLKHLTRFTLSSTSIDELDYYYFGENHELTYIDLSNNKLTTMSHMSFHNVHKLVTLNLANNKLQEFPYLPSTNNKLVLDLSRNHIYRISSADLMHLKPSSINLTNNVLTTIDFSEVWSYSSGETINTTLYLDGNPINCDDSLIDFIAYNEQPEKRMQITVVGGECSTPPSLGKRPLEQIDFNILMRQRSNFSSELCSIDCDCNFRLPDRMFVMNCTEIGLRQLHRFPIIKHFGYAFIELYFANQNVTEFPNLTHIEGVANVIAVNASNNNIRRLSRAMLSDNWTSLDLSNNKLVSVDKDVIDSWEGNAKLEKLWLNGNPYECNCDTQLLKAFYSNTSKVINYRGITCANKAGKPLHEVDDLCTDGNIVIIAATLAAFIVTLLFAFYYKYRDFVCVWLYATFGRSIGRYLPEKPFDAFVSFAEPESDYVFNNLAPALENGPERYRLCIHERDWIAAPIMEQIHESVRDSRYTIILLSKNFLRSNWCVAEFRAAQIQANQEKRSNVIMIMYGDIEDDDVKNSAAEMQAYLRANTYLKWNDPWFLRKLRYSLRRSRRERGGVRTLINNNVMEMSVQQNTANSSV